MPKASIKLPDGTSVVIEGSPEEVAKIVAFYGVTSTSPQGEKVKQKGVIQKAKGRATTKKDSDDTPNLPEIINLVKTCDEAEVIETNILDKVGQVNRILLSLYIVHEHFNNAHGLTTGEVSQIMKELGIPVHMSNVSHTLSGTASKYVIADRIRKKGQSVRYKISRRGITYLKGVLKGK